MTAIEIINTKNSTDVNAYTADEVNAIKAYGWKQYGLGAADTLRMELTTIDRDAYLDETFC